MPPDPGMVRTPARPQRAPGPVVLLQALLRVLPHLPGMARTTWAYLTRSGSVVRSFHECDGPAPEPDPDRLLPGVERSLLRRSDGRGPLYRRRYEGLVADARIGPEELITRLLVDPNRASPTDVAVFEPEGTGR